MLVITLTPKAMLVFNCPNLIKRASQNVYSNQFTCNSSKMNGNYCLDKIMNLKLLSQDMSFSCDVGGSISRSVPLKNAGNVPIVVKMECDQHVFTVHPDVLELKQNEVSYMYCVSMIYMYMSLNQPLTKACSVYEV